MQMLKNATQQYVAPSNQLAPTNLTNLQARPTTFGVLNDGLVNVGAKPTFTGQQQEQLIPAKYVYTNGYDMWYALINNRWLLVNELKS